MAKETWALDLGEWSLKVVRGRADKKTGRIVIDLYDEIRYDTLDVGEEATSADKFQAGLAAFAGKYQVPKRANLCVAVSGSEVFSRFINLPPVPESISEIIHYEARQQIPFDISEVVWDYQPIKEEHQPGEEIEVGLFALKREGVDELMRLLAPWRRNLRVVQDAPLAVYNLLRFEGVVNEPMIVLDMGASTTDLLVVNPPRFWLRPLLLGGNAITERIQTHFGISYQESERIKERASESAREAQLLRVIRPVVGNMLSEIQRSLGYYKSLAKGVKFTKILALGNAFKLRGLDKALAEGLQYPIEELTDIQRFDFAPPLTRKDFLPHLGGACSALGLLVQGLGLGHIKINLVPEELTRAAVMGRKRPMLVGAAAGLLVIALIFVVSERAQSKELAGNVGTGEEMDKRIRRIDQDFAEAQRQTKVQEDKLKSLAQPEVGRDILLQIIPDIVQALPPDTVYISEMKFTWSGRAEFDRMAQEGRTEVSRPAEVGPMIAPVGGAPGMEAFPGRTPMRYGPRGLVRPEAGQPAGAAAARGGTALIVTMDCESTVIERGLDYIQNEVIKRLEDRRWPDGTPVFRKVAQVGNTQSIFRDASTGGLPNQLTEGEEITQFVAFRLVAEVNLTGTGAKRGGRASRETAARPEG